MTEEAIDLRAMKAAAEKAAKSTSSDYKLWPRERSIHVSYRDVETGELRTANLVSRVMSGDERAVMLRMEASLAGVPWAQLSPLQGSRVHCIAKVMCQLVSPPEWVIKAVSQDDFLLTKIFGLLEEHENAYFRRDSSTGQEGEVVEGLVVSWADSK